MMKTIIIPEHKVRINTAPLYMNQIRRDFTIIIPRGDRINVRLNMLHERELST